jgi:mono/diheme cytochrome c family protein
MKRFIFSIGCILSAGAGGLPAAAPAADRTGDIALQTRAIFAAKCAGCHGANLVKPRGRFGYVLDLARVAANPEMVVPFFPDESELWELVRRGEMPPADAPTGPLSNEQKELIRAWIAAGAPANPARSTTPEPDTACRSSGATATAQGELRQRVSLPEERR